MKNWKTTAGAIVAIVVAVLQLLGVEIPGVNEHTLGAVGLLGGALGLTQAKDKDVTGVGVSAHRVKQ